MGTLYTAKLQYRPSLSAPWEDRDRADVLYADARIILVRLNNVNDRHFCYSPTTGEDDHTQLWRICPEDLREAVSVGTTPDHGKAARWIGARYKLERDAARDLVNELRTANEQAPHSDVCRLFAARDSKYAHRFCDCWKTRALALTTAAPSPKLATYAQQRIKEQELNEEVTLREKLAYLLTHTAGALKGRPEPLHSHDWSDLPKIAAELRRELTAKRDIRKDVNLRTRVLNSLHVYYDFKTQPDGSLTQFAYLRFIPEDMEPFRHGLSTGVIVDLDERGEPVLETLRESKEAAADWLIEVWQTLLEDA